MNRNKNGEFVNDHPGARRRVSGFEFKVCGYTVEIVTVNYIPRILAIWQGNIFIKRWEV